MILSKHRSDKMAAGRGPRGIDGDDAAERKGLTRVHPDIGDLVGGRFRGFRRSHACLPRSVEQPTRCELPREGWPGRPRLVLAGVLVAHWSMHPDDRFVCRVGACCCSRVCGPTWRRWICDDAFLINGRPLRVRSDCIAAIYLDYEYTFTACQSGRNIEYIL